VKMSDGKDFMSTFNNHLANIDKAFDKYVLKQFPSVKTSIDKVGIRPAYLVVGFVAFVFLFVLFGVGANPLCNLVGFVYPMYASFKALKTGDKDDDTTWLTYWVVYGFFTVAESLTDFLALWIPFYYLIKISFLIWCMHPITQGSKKIYDFLIEPLLSKYEEHIDNAFGVGNGQKKGTGKHIESE